MEGSKTLSFDGRAPSSSEGLIIRQKEPKNLESPFDRIDSYLTPSELFYIRSHFPTPDLDRASYQLRIDTLLARAKDAGGLIQPDKHDRNYGVYVINHPLPIEVFVDDSGGPRS
jgi:hypothetical protein